MNKIGIILTELSDQLDSAGFTDIATNIDDLSKVASNYPAWGEPAGRQQEYTLFQRYKNKELTKDQYLVELKKLQDKKKMESDPYLEQKTQVK